MNLLRNSADVTGRESLSNKLRRKRFALFMDIYKSFGGKHVNILDIGGTVNFWEQMNFTSEHCTITLLNPEPETSPYPGIVPAAGRAEELQGYKENQFDIVFSNSVIEHLGTFENQRLMAEEVKRLAPVYFIQTPAYEFPIEPHFLFPGFHYMPRRGRIFLTEQFNLGWYKKAASRKEAEERVDEIRLLKKSEMQTLFSDAEITEEKFLGLTKSYTAVRRGNTDV